MRWLERWAIRTTAAVLNDVAAMPFIALELDKAPAEFEKAPALRARALSSRLRARSSPGERLGQGAQTRCWAPFGRGPRPGR
eukprot:9083204-Pyramimonas_sp.AAC.1